MHYFFTLIFIFVHALGSFAQEHVSIHQEELNYFNSKGNASADYYESFPNKRPITLEKGSCSLNKIVYGWHPYWSGSTYTNYNWDLLSHFSFFSYEVNSTDGQPISTHGWGTSAAVDAALASGSTKVTLCVTLFSGHSTFFGNSSAQQTLITNLINLIQSRGADGVNIDFEGLPSSQTNAFANFMVNLSNQMHAAIPGSEVSTVLYAVDWNNVFDFSTMEPAVDHYIIMGYDYYYSGSSTAGPTDPLYQFGNNYNYTLSRSITYYLKKGCPANKLVLGLPYYGWDYPTTGTTIPSNTAGAGSSRTYSVVKTNSTGNFSAVNQSWLSDAINDAFIYNNGVDRQSFISLDSAFAKRLDHVNKSGIAGIGMWALGYDNGYSERWNSIQDYMTDCYTDPCSGDIHDFGGPIKSYYDNENYTWTIQPENAVSLTVNFTEFNVEANYDYLYIYDGATSAAPQIVGSPFTGSTSPGNFTTTSGAVTFKFTSDVSTVAAGFKANYYCQTLQPPTASFSLPTALTLCQGDSILLSSNSIGAETYNWTSTEGIITNSSSADTYFIPSSSGIYTIDLMTSNSSGSDVESISSLITIEPQPIAEGSVNSNYFTLPNATAFFTNSSTNANGYYWSFGDGSSSTDTEPWHTYVAEGIYTVSLIAEGILCANDTMNWIITVGTAGIEEGTNNLMRIYPNPASESLYLVFNSEFDGRISILDLNGRIIQEIEVKKSLEQEVNVSSLSSGAYILRFANLNKEGFQRFIKL